MTRPPRHPIRIELWRRRVHLPTAALVLDLHGRHLNPEPAAGRHGDACAFAVVATGVGRTILSAAFNKRFPSEAAVASLDRAVETLARAFGLGRAEFWRLHSERIVVVTDGEAPFSSHRFVEAVRDLGCELHTERPSE